MNLLKKIALGASLAFATTFATAATYDLADYVGGTGTVNAGFSVTNSDSQGVFSDIFNFVYGWGADSLELTALSLASTDVEQFTSIEIVNVDTGLVGYFGNFSTAVVEIADAQLVSGDAYVMTLTGVAGNGANYTLTGGPISPVPEPSVIALMLGGIGLVGFMANRRRKLVG